MRTPALRWIVFFVGLAALAAFGVARAGAQGKGGPVDGALERLTRIGKLELRDWRWRQGENAKGGDVGLDTGAWGLVNPGHQWRGENTEGWYRKSVEIPEKVSGFGVAGSAVKLEVGLDDFGEIWVNGEKRQSFNWDDGVVVLTEKAKAGDAIEVAIRARNRGGPGGMLHARLSFAALTDVEEAVTHYSEALGAARSIVKSLGKGDERWSACLDKSVAAIDFDGAGAGDRIKFLTSLEKARGELSSLKEVTKDYRIRCVGYSHIDLAWLWRWRETVQVTKETFASAIQFMEEFPDFKFSMSQSHAYRWMEERYPELFAAIQKSVKDGRWEIVGGTAVELDCNLPDAESQIRQIVHGQRYFEEKFGKRAKIGWCPDSFGYNANLPQILKKSGMDYFVTSKISWNDTNKFPHNLFWWQAPDGSRVLTFLPLGGYDNDLQPGPMIEYLTQIEKKNDVKDIMMVYGVGNHGGGPTREMLRREERLSKMDFFPKIEKSTAIEYFDSIDEKTKAKLPTWNDEMYLEFHRGTYTTQAANKRANRKGEVGLMTAETMATFASLTTLKEYPADELDKAWDYLLFNQMHDILPGSSIAPVYRDSAEDYARMFGLIDSVISTSAAYIMAAHGGRAGWVVEEARRLDILSPNERVYVAQVFNPLSWVRDDVATLKLGSWDWDSAVKVYDPSQEFKKIACQVVDDGMGGKSVLFPCEKLPSIGFRHYLIISRGTQAMPVLPAAEGDLSLENAHIAAKVDVKTGKITSLVHKASGRETFVKPANTIQILEDKPKVYDAWELGFTGKQWNLDDAASVEWIEQGPVRWTIRVKKTFLGDTKEKRKPTEDFPSSFFTQDISLYCNLPWLETRFSAEWWEDHACVKIEFPLTIAPPTATYEAPYAQVERSTRRDTPWEKARYEVPAQKWADMSLDGFGVSILNESKYGYDALQNVLRLTCFRAPKSPDPMADRGRHGFRYAVFPHAGTWRDGGTVKAAYQFNHPLVVMQSADPIGYYALGVTTYAEQWGGTSFAPLQPFGVDTLRPTAGGAPDPPEGITRQVKPNPGISSCVDNWVMARQSQPIGPEDALVSCSAENVMLPVVKLSVREQGAFAVRCVEWAGKPDTMVSLTFPFPLESASHVNLLEENPKPIDVKENVLSFPIGPHAIETVLVQPKR